jgi:hypothetical protein
MGFNTIGAGVAIGVTRMTFGAGRLSIRMTGCRPGKGAGMIWMSCWGSAKAEASVSAASRSIFFMVSGYTAVLVFCSMLLRIRWTVENGEPGVGFLRYAKMTRRKDWFIMSHRARSLGFLGTGRSVWL